MRLTTMLTTALICLAGTMTALPAVAQSGAQTAATNGTRTGASFAPVLIVNGSPITGYELAQREKFLQLLNAPGDIAKLAEKQLIQDRLQLQAADENGIEADKAEVDAGMKEFAGRANMTTEQFVAALAKAGVAEQTYRAFVRAGVAWRNLVRSKFGAELTVSDADVNRALSLAAQPREPRLLLSEILLPATPQYFAQSAALAEQLAHTVTTPAQFAAAARQYSGSQSAARGGRIDWVPEANLPPAVAGALKGLKPGQVSSPVKLQNAIGLFLLRAIGEMPRPAPSKVTLKYAQYLIPGGRTPENLKIAAGIVAKVGDCNDLYGIAKGKPKGTLTFTTQTVPQVPSDIAMRLATMDQNEIATDLTRGGNLDVLMLCTRRLTVAETANIDDIRNQLANQRLAGLSESYLARLRADAFIRRP